MKDLASQVAQAWRSMQEKTIHGAHDAAIAAAEAGPEAQKLAMMKGEDAAKADADERERLNADLADAIKRGDVKAQKEAQAAIEKYNRDSLERQLQDAIDAKKAEADRTEKVAMDGLDNQTADYERGLGDQLGALVGNLEARKIAYATWAQQVNAILAPYGLSAQTDANTEAAVNAGGGPLAPPTNNAGLVFRPGIGMVSGPGAFNIGRASGGMVYPGISYTVGETGPERFTPRVPGVIHPAGRGGGGGGVNVHMSGPVYMGSSADAQKSMNKLAFRLKYG